MAIPDDLRYYLKLKALCCIYEKKYTHTETAKQLGISRVTLNRLLEEAQDEGMIKVDIVDTKNLKSTLELEDRLKTRLGLNDVKLVNVGSSTSNSSVNFSMECARYVQMFLRSRMKVGLAWGRALRAMLNFLTPLPGVSDIDVYTLLGGAYNEADLQPNVMVQTMLGLYPGNGHVINAPYICHSELLCSELKKEPSIAQILEETKTLDLAIVGIGENPNSLHFKDGYYHFSDTIVSELIEAGAVGDICGNFFDQNGRVCQTSISSRIVSIELENLKTCKKVIGIARGDRKLQSILGAINGGYIDSLVTDTETAAKLLAQ